MSGNLVCVTYDERFLDRAGDWHNFEVVDFFYAGSLDQAFESVKRFDTYNRITGVVTRWATDAEIARFNADVDGF